MRGKAAVVAFFLAIGARPALAAPDLAACGPVEPAEGWERERSTPLPVPAALRGLVRTDLLHLSLITLDGGAICIDTSYMESAEDMALTPDSRFLSVGWLGYEAYGHFLIDRKGRGEAVETGVRPVFSPSRRYFAAADQTESDFGTLSGLVVWEVLPSGTREIDRVDELPRLHDWRVDGWVSESCIALSAVPLEAPPEESSRQARIRFRAGPGPDRAGWTVSRSTRSCDAR